MNRFPAVLAAALCLAGPAASFAQDTGLYADEQVVLKQIQTDKRALYASNLKLTESESVAFWKVYDEYELAAKKLDDRFLKLLNSYVAEYDTLSDEAAAAMLKEKMAIEKDRMALKQRYTAKVAKVLPPKKALRYAQVETRVENIVRGQTYSIIPLAR
jgi:Spy/CpxP family protein refolding chaperone